MIRLIRLALLAFLFTVIAPVAFHAQQPTLFCQPYAAMEAKLIKEYGEVPSAMGVSVHGGLMVTYVDPKDESWTIIIVAGNGGACIIAGGDDYMAIPAPPSGEPT
jgi:hypothetical protein